MSCQSSGGQVRYASSKNTSMRKRCFRNSESCWGYDYWGDLKVNKLVRDTVFKWAAHHSAHWNDGRVKAPSRAWAYASIYGICVHAMDKVSLFLNNIYAILINHYSGVLSFSACKLWILKRDVLGQLHITYHTSKSILKTARAGRRKRDMTAREQVHLMAFKLAEQQADAIKAISMISMNRISLKLIWALTFHVGRLYLKPR